jgi:histidyl-tRNA synthetase
MTSSMAAAIASSASLLACWCRIGEVFDEPRHDRGRQRPGVME